MNAAPRARVLIVDDEPALRRGLARALMGAFDVLTAEDGASALGLLATTRVDAVLLDLGLPGPGGAGTLARLRADHPETEVVVMAAHDEVEAALAAVRAGAFSFLLKPLDPEAAVAIALTRAVERRRLVGRARVLEGRASSEERFGALVGGSARMQETLRKTLGASRASAPVLIVGERGTGKEQIARAIHQRSPREARSFVALSCSAIPEALLEGELFGAGGSPGALEAAGEGTLFLEDVDALPLAAQVRLLRAMDGDGANGGEDGGGAARRPGARVIAATTVDLRERISAGRFREDLHFRLAVVSILVPPLRLRREDIPLLALHYLRRHRQQEGREVRRIGPEAMRLLREHGWPGNLPELEHAIEHAAAVARGEAVTPADLPPTIAGASGPARKGRGPAEGLAELPYAEARERALLAFERAYVDTVIERAGGNISEAARQAGMDRANFRRLKKRVEGRGPEDEDGEGEP